MKRTALMSTDVRGLTVQKNFNCSFERLTCYFVDIMRK